MIGSKFDRASSASNYCAVSDSNACERWIAIRTSSCGASDSRPWPGSRLVEHLAQHREVGSQHDLVGGEPVRSDESAAMKVIGRADMVEVLVAQHHHVDVVGLHAEMLETSQQ